MRWNYQVLDKDELLIGEGEGYPSAEAAFANAKNDLEDARENEDEPGQYDIVQIVIKNVFEE